MAKSRGQKRATKQAKRRQRLRQQAARPIPAATPVHAAPVEMMSPSEALALGFDPEVVGDLESMGFFEPVDDPRTLQEMVEAGDPRAIELAKLLIPERFEEP